MRKLLARLAMVLVGLGLALALGELTLRLFPGVLDEEARLRLHWAGLGADARTTVAHPTIGYVARPGLEETLERTDLSFHYRIDPNGFRNPWPWPERADVVVTGDSLAFGYGVDDGEGWTDRLKERFPGLSLVNLGITGAAPQMGLAAYEAYGAALHPKVVLFGLFLGNDVYDARKFDEWQRSGAGGNFGVWRALGGHGASVQGWLRGMVQRSFLFAFWRERQREPGQPGRTIDLPEGGRVQLVPGMYWGARVAPGSPDYDLVLGAVTAAAERVRSDGASLALLFFPTKEEVYLSDQNALGLGLSSLLDPFRPALEERGIAVVDPLPSLVAHRDEQLYFEIDGHPNARGYALIADVVAEHLRAHAAEYGLDL